MKYRYLIIDEWDAVWGTNSLGDATTASEEDGNLVFDLKVCEIMQADGGREEVDEYSPEEEDEDEDKE